MLANKFEAFFACEKTVTHIYRRLIRRTAIPAFEVTSKIMHTGHDVLDALIALIRILHLCLLPSIRLLKELRLSLVIPENIITQMYSPYACGIDVLLARHLKRMHILCGNVSAHHLLGGLLGGLLDEVIAVELVYRHVV